MNNAPQPTCLALESTNSPLRLRGDVLDAQSLLAPCFARIPPDADRDIVLCRAAAVLADELKLARKGATVGDMLVVRRLFHAWTEVRVLQSLDRQGVADRMRDLREYTPDRDDQDLYDMSMAVIRGAGKKITA